MILRWQPILWIFVFFLSLEFSLISMERPSTENLINTLQEALEESFINEQSKDLQEVLKHLEQQVRTHKTTYSANINYPAPQELYHLCWTVIENINTLKNQQKKSLESSGDSAEIKQITESIKKHIQAIEDYFLKNANSQSIDNILEEQNSYIKAQLQSIERFDPPFFKLVTHNGREIYILGSLHNRDPRFLLSQLVFNFIQKNLLSKAILFIEHPKETGVFNTLRTSGLSAESPSKWSPSQFELNNNQQETWGKIKGWNVFDDDSTIKIEFFTKLEPNLGLMLLYGFSGKYAMKTGYTQGFEQFFLDMQWKEEEVQYLEDIEEAFNLVGEKNDSVKYFKHGLLICSKVDSYLKELASNKPLAFDRVLNNYKLSIKQYKHKDSKHETESSLARNEKWSIKVKNYLDKHGDKSEDPPLLIVCGMAHLEGGWVEGTQSFLKHLLETNKFEIVGRMGKNGQWIYHSQY